MSTNKLRCNACLGQKEYAGIGGIIKPCRKCEAKGFIVVCVQTSSSTPPVLETAVNETIKIVKPKRKSATKTKVNEPQTQDMFQDTCTLSETFNPPVDLFTTAILDEPRMKPDEWQAKYKNVPGLFGKDITTGAQCEAISKVQRAQMRAIIAQSQPKIKRKVDMTKSQDVNGDLQNVD